MSIDTRMHKIEVDLVGPQRMCAKFTEDRDSVPNRSAWPLRLLGLNVILQDRVSAGSSCVPRNAISAAVEAPQQITVQRSGHLRTLHFFESTTRLIDWPWWTTASSESFSKILEELPRQLLFKIRCVIFTAQCFAWVVPCCGRYDDSEGGTSKNSAVAVSQPRADVTERRPSDTFP